MKRLSVCCRIAEHSQYGMRSHKPQNCENCIIMVTHASTGMIKINRRSLVYHRNISTIKNGVFPRKSRRKARRSGTGNFFIRQKSFSAAAAEVYQQSRKDFIILWILSPPMPLHAVRKRCAKISIARKETPRTQISNSRTDEKSMHSR